MAAKLSEDYPIDALALEADRRAKQLGRRYSYGMLIADTTPQERQEITEKYRRSSDKDDVKRFHRKHAETEDEG